jgi:short/branched chain acyl-CoA dehydrogenase
VDLDLSHEQRAVRDLCREFAVGEIVPRAARLDETGDFPYELVAKMGKLGLFALPFAEAVGGAGGDFLSYCLALEEVGRADAACALTLEAAVSLGITPLVRYATPEQRDRWLPPLLAGERLWAFGLTEPGSGSDAAGLLTRAREDGDVWVIDGHKAFITNAGTDISAGVTVAAVTGSSDGRKRISTIAVERGTEGFTPGPKYRKLGWHASDTRPLIFDSCTVPRGNLVGVEGRGLEQFLHVLEGGRVAVAAMSVGLAQACLDQCLRYTSERHQFGVALSTFQATQFKLADMATQIEAARLLTWKAAWLTDHGRAPGVYASMAKLHASEVATACASQAVQIHGGAGFMEDSPVARFYRDAKAGEIGEGTSEVQRILIARELLRSLEPA